MPAAEGWWQGWHGVAPFLSDSRVGRGERSLIPREVDVNWLLSQAMTGVVVVDPLGISINTVRSHMKRIYVKLNVSKRILAITKAERQGVA